MIENYYREIKKNKNWVSYSGQEETCKWLVIIFNIMFNTILLGKMFWKCLMSILVISVSTEKIHDENTGDKDNYSIRSKVGEPHYFLNSDSPYSRISLNAFQDVIYPAKQIIRVNRRSFGWEIYQNLEDIYAWLDSLVDKYPDKIQIIVGGKTYEGREIKGVKLSFGKQNPGIFIEGGIHAREWITPATVTFVLNELLSSKDKDVRELAEKYDWYMFPIFNPDGYVFSHTKIRWWRKTRSNPIYSDNSGCNGVDANRNWDFQWMANDGASNTPCSEIYAGSVPFSEIETKSMSEYLKSIKDQIFAYIAFHSYGQYLTFPYGYTKEHLDNYNESYAIGLKAIEALSKRYGTQYRIGNLAETVYIVCGSSTDWVKATLKLPIVYLYELRDTGKHKHSLSVDQIIPNGEEVLDSLIAMFKEAARFGYPKNHN